MKEGLPLKLEKLEEYDNLLREHDALLRKLRRLHRSVKAMAKDSEMMEKILEVDLKTNEAHVKLRSVARELGMTESDTLADILRLQNSLEGYGLPEFSILNSDDIVVGSVFKEERCAEYNIDDFTGKPREIISKKNALETKLGLKKYMGWIGFSGGYPSAIDEDEVLIIFSVSTKIIEGYDVIGADDPIDMDVRVRRARALAKEVGGRFFEGEDFGYHSGPASITGVVIKKSNLVRVASIIRSEPGKYRLGEEFYSNDEAELVKKRKKQQDEEREELKNTMVYSDYED